MISLQILEEDSYEKDVLFYLEIDEPTQLGGTYNDVMLRVRVYRRCLFVQKLVLRCLLLVY